MYVMHYYFSFYIILYFYYFLKEILFITTHCDTIYSTFNLFLIFLSFN